MANIRDYNIKYPFTLNNVQGYFVDINENADEKIASDILHVVLTRKRTRIRRPEFGTDLMSFIFNESDGITWDQVKGEASEAISKYVRNVRLRNMEVYRDDENSIILILYYDSIQGGETINNKLTVKL